MAAPETRYFVLWKGRQSGPFSLAQIRTQLAAGEISRMHQIGDGGAWQMLDEFLARHPDETESRRAAEMAQREAQLRGEFEAKLAAERSRQAELEAQLAGREERSSLAHLLPRQPPPPPPPAQPAFPVLQPTPEPQPQAAPGQTRTSGLAIAALVMGLCNFIPYVNFFSWILALVFGHTALAQMKRDPGLDGRGMAITGLAITYFLLLLGLTVVVLLIANQQKIPSLF